MAKDKAKSSDPAWRKYPSHNLPRCPSFALYPDDQKNKKVIEKYWVGIMGSSYSLAEVNRILWRQEADRITAAADAEKAAS